MNEAYLVFEKDALPRLLRSLADHLSADDERDAYIANAQYHLDQLRSTIHDGLAGKNDLYLKVSLMQDVDAIHSALAKAAA